MFQYVNLRGGTGHCLPLSLRGYGSQVPVESHQRQQHRHYTASSDGHRQVGVSASQLITFHNYMEEIARYSSFIHSSSHLNYSHHKGETALDNALLPIVRHMMVPCVLMKINLKNKVKA